MFYVRFLEKVNHFQNPFAEGITQSDFIERNFVIIENLEKYNIENGNLSVTLKFKENLAENLILLYLPITDRTLVFDSNIGPHVV